MKVYSGMDPRLPLRDVAGYARRVEQLGFDGLHVAETIHDSLAVALLALEHTTTMTVRTSITLAFVRSPTLVAYTAWDLAVMSGGRFELGLGSQIKQNIRDRYGMPWSEPRSRMRDYLGALSQRLTTSDPRVLKHLARAFSALGVRAEDGWGAAEILAGGYGEPEAEIRAQGGVLLDAWHEVAPPFLPAGAAPGPVLREQAVTYQGQSGRRYMTPWERLDAAAPGRAARVVFDRALMGCWIAQLVRSGVVPEAHPAIVAEKRAGAAERVERKLAEVNLPTDVRERRVGRATEYANQRAAAEIVHV